MSSITPLDPNDGPQLAILADDDFIWATSTTYVPSPFPQMERFLQMHGPSIKLFVSGMQLLVIPSDNLYDMMDLYMQFLSPRVVNSWHQQDEMERYVYGGYLGWTLSRFG